MSSLLYIINIGIMPIKSLILNNNYAAIIERREVIILRSQRKTSLILNFMKFFSIYFRILFYALISRYVGTSARYNGRINQ
jgi:hypothetical protein